MRAPAGLKLRMADARPTPPAAVAGLPREQLRPFSASEPARARGAAGDARAGRAAPPTAGGGAPPLPGTAAATTAAPAASPRSAASDASRADVMRLTAYVDDLTTRLHATQSKLEATERHLTRTSQALAVERQAATAKINTLHRDVTSSKEREDKLKSELHAPAQGGPQHRQVCLVRRARSPARAR